MIYFYKDREDLLDSPMKQGLYIIYTSGDGLGSGIEVFLFLATYMKRYSFYLRRAFCKGRERWVKGFERWTLDDDIESKLKDHGYITKK